ncbi:MAG: glutamine synthetase family protein [Alphaproteobacteria bacterium]|nr:glutamine synthetase family protein [Alphaproteobacteria bacterium]MBU0795764.1 glutamine synthetase family protein [Alphaproteobacteria bacterium]MBU0887387.1 glutamine synthetase family protein [Alphaproteobacteria bacterium]MBU1811732.1 glutamine synthetase family protein [Alphaproteobacteria bacterium]MBU2092069.1 glutamine synthetase family protein [Alphaproteobacteria bacterium]
MSDSSSFEISTPLPESLAAWIAERNIDEVECLVPDLAGIPRGKILPAQKFLNSWGERGLRLPESIFTQTVTGDFPDDVDINPADSDVYLVPDLSTMRIVPWYSDPTAQVINDCYYADGRPVDIASRQVLKHVLALYEAEGWDPVVAPEVEFFLVKPNTDPDYPLEPPIGRSGRAETARQSFGIDAVNEFDPIFEDVYRYCELQQIDIDTLSHESGAAQMEINFNHGEALSLADQVFLFKRTLRQSAMSHNVYATFMSKPMQGQPGSSMHIHVSLVDKKTGQNMFSQPNGEDTPRFLAFIAGLQRYLPRAMPLMAPYVNSYRRFGPHFSAPQNVHWGRDNRTTGLRVPLSSAKSRRVENRVAGADANPYLAIAATLAAGYLGIMEELEATAPVEGDAYGMSRALPVHLQDALGGLYRSKELRTVLGDRFVDVLCAVKEWEYDAYQQVISAWEREFLLLNV